MSVVIETEAPPLQQDATGALRIGASRVLLELVIQAFQDGATPETIVQRYPTTTLSDIYAVIAYYLVTGRKPTSRRHRGNRSVPPQPLTVPRT